MRVFLCILGVAILLIPGLLYALGGAHHPYSFAVFQAYGIVWNNLHHPELTGWIPVIHPIGEDGNVYPYLSYFSSAYFSCLSALAAIFGLGVTELRVYSVILYLFPLGSAYVLARVMKANLFACWLVLFLAIDMLLFASACDLLTFHFGFTCLLLAWLAREGENPGQPSWQLVLLGFCASICNWMSFIVFFYVFVGLLIYRFFYGEGSSWKIIKIGVVFCVGLGIGLLTAWGQTLLLPEETLGVTEYFPQRSKLEGNAIDLGLMLYVFDRLWAFLSRTYPAFILIIGAVVLSGVRTSQDDQPKRLEPNEALLLIGMGAWTCYFLMINQTTTEHFYFGHIYLLLGAVLTGVVATRFRGRFQPLVLGSLISLVLILGLNSWRKTHFWNVGPTDVEKFLENELRKEDFLIRTNKNDVWPLQPSAPERTLFTNLKSLEDSLDSVKERKVGSFAKSHNTVFIVEGYADWVERNIPLESRVFLFAEDRNLNWPIVARDHRYTLYQVLGKE